MKKKTNSSDKKNTSSTQSQPMPSETQSGLPKHIARRMKELEKMGFKDTTEEKLGQTSVYFVPRRK